MPYPFWNQPLGQGLLMATIAVFHVFLAHLAIGGGLYLVVAEQLARKRGASEELTFLEDLSRGFLLLSLVLGAVSGVGIWFVIGLLNPAGTEALIRVFVWAWATEWTFFVVEVAAALCYYYGWRTLTARAHLTLGWIYFVAAWLSLAAINGIVTFMLTPGDWLTTGGFWSGFFNPTYWPSLVLRTGVALTLGAVYVFVFASLRRQTPLGLRHLRLASLWGILGLALAVPAARWYWLQLPELVQTTLLERLPGPVKALWLAAALAAALALLFSLFGLVFPRRAGVPVALLAVVLAFTSLGAFEWFREGARKPFVIPGYMYATGLPVASPEESPPTALLPGIAYRSESEGADLFRIACGSCHTLRGTRPLGPFADGLDLAYLSRLVQETGTMRARMPPFPGTPEEASKLGEYLGQASDRRPLEEVLTTRGATLGSEVWRRRCEVCHLPGGFRDCLPTLQEMTREEIRETLADLEMYSEKMPAFTGSEVEREAMIDYLESLRRAPGQSTPDQEGAAGAASKP